MIIFKRLSVVCVLLMVACQMFAVPAKRVWRKVLIDGVETTVRKCGDEHFSYYRSEAGTLYVRNGEGILCEVDSEELSLLSAKAPRRTKANSMKSRVKGVKTLKKAEELNDGDEVVRKRALVIMVSFSDLQFTDKDPQAVWHDILNEEGYNKHGAMGCASDYFHDQSNGLFDITFDVVGPVNLPETHYYYGKNKSDDIDINMGECVAEACKAVDSDVDFRNYDWDNDGEADLVFILYAGCGENATDTNIDLIWPHQYYLSGYLKYRKGLTLDNTLIDTYACSCELDGEETDKNKPLTGIGTFCHEFSHCLGLPDLYDTEGTGLAMLEDWDLMDYGSYNAGGWYPPNYSAYERECCGWQTPVLLTSPTSVTGMKALGNGGETYKIVNDKKDGSQSEYYLMENRQKTGWDKYLPGSGVLVTHIYYRELYWKENKVNTSKTYPGVSFIPANNKMQYSGNVTYPYTNPRTGMVNDSITDTSKPAAKVFDTNINGKKLMGKPITNIKVVDSIASFDFCKSDSWVDTAISPIAVHENALFGQPAIIYNSKGHCVKHTDSYKGLETMPRGLYIVKGLDGRSVKVIK